MSFVKLCFVIVVFVTMVAVGSSSATCSLATLTGVWGYWVGGAGQFTADGKGNITAGSQTVSNGGTIVTQTFTGTYSVATNCTGSLTINFTGGGSATANFVLDQTNKGLQLIPTISGNTGSGFGAAEGTVTCGLTGMKKTYAALLTGKYPGTGVHVDYVLQVILDGHGHITGSGTFNVGGTITTSSSLSGSTYTENSNCTGTATIIGGPTTLNLDFVLAAAGKELFMVETDSGTSVAGFALQ